MFVMEKALYEKVIEILTRLEDKIDSIDERTQDIEQRLDETEPTTSQWFGGGVQ
jgi:DNA replication initiation complex subunit (GINS family)